MRVQPSIGLSGGDMAQQVDKMTNIEGVAGLDPAPQPRGCLRAHWSKRHKIISEGVILIQVQ